MTGDLLLAADRLDALTDEVGDLTATTADGDMTFTWAEQMRTIFAPEVGAYFTAMSPTAGKAIAAWLRLEAEVIASDQSPERLAAHAVAVAVLGGAA